MPESTRLSTHSRIATPSVILPALRDRPEEIPALIAHALAGRSPPQAPHVSFVEQCLLRPWPGNVRELLAEVRAAAQSALADGGRVAAQHLAPTAGSAFGRGGVPAGAPPAAGGEPSSPDGARTRVSRDSPAWRARIEESLRAHGGNKSATARALGLHRTELCRLIKRLDIADDGRDD